MLSLRSEDKIRARRLELARGPLSAEDTRRRRAGDALRLRNDQREEAMAKRRREVTPETGVGAESAESVSLKLSELPGHIEAIFSNEVNILLTSLISLRKLLSLESRPPIQQCVDAGVIPRLVELLQYNDHPEIQYESCWTLTNIASGSSTQTAAVVNAGAVQALIPLMTSPELDVRGQCVWTLANIAGDSAECRDYVLRMGAMSPLLAILTGPNPSARIQRDATWMLSNLCRGNDAPWDIISVAVPVLARLLYSADNDVLMDACWALLFLTQADSTRASRLLQEGIGPQIVSLLRAPSHAVQMPALRVVGNILFGDEEQTQTLLNLNVLSGLEHLLKSDNKRLRKEACWSLSNIAAGTRTQIQTLIDYKPIMDLIFDFLDYSDSATQYEAIFVICNAINESTLEQVRQLVQMGCIKALSHHLDTYDDKALKSILEAVDHILDCGMKDIKVSENHYVELFEDVDADKKLESLNTHHSEELFRFSVKILKKYWPTEDENTTPNVNLNGSYAW